ncbi:FtsX-like permease family protein [Haloimpatiens lingqiaonensis]|uniref:FtsX-like permease family protein n=1 Tax=Haloimpatiens lingqiaonensis TaxID=1380675 RepID=UPI0010FEAEAD|nr:ABC transporter permease [Haloimpatiens lingqiaonensis]
MKIFSMAIRNIRSNFKNYWAYFLSSSFSVFIVYLFMSILYSKNIQDNLGGVKNFITLFNVGATMIALFSAFFIWYSNSFFIKSRKKEFATYMLLGMSKKQVSRLNFLENILIMLASLITGVVLGLVFTKFFIMLLFFIIKVSADVPFQWNLRALKISVLIFLGIFAVITLHGAFVVRKSNLIDLFNASKKVEKGLKVSFVTIILSILAMICMGSGYYIAIKKLPTDITKSPVVVILVVVGIILFFTSTTSLIIHMNKKNERKLFKGTKLISVSQLYYRYRGNAGTLSTIAITTTVALCALVTCVGSYTKCEQNSRYMRPLSVEYFNVDKAQSTFDGILKNHNEISVKHKDSIEFLNIVEIDKSSEIARGFYVINESEFDKLSEHQGIERKANLKSDSDCYFIQINNFVENEVSTNEKISLKVGKKDYKMTVVGSDGKPFISLDHFNKTVVVTDNVYNEMKSSVNKRSIINMTGYTFEDDFSSGKFVADLAKNMSKDSGLRTFYDHYSDGLKLLGMMAFIGLFIGILFIMATGSIIYFKMTMEAREDKSKYKTLRNIGVSKKEIKKAISKELLVLFGAPLVVAIISTYPATYALEKMLLLDLMKSYAVIALVYAAIYCLYYFATLNSYVKTVE